MIAMRYLVVLCCVVAAVVAEEKYSDKYDNINLKEILENDRLFTAYADCIMERGKCTPEGTELKSHMGDALENGCAKCTDAQKEGAQTVINHMINKHIDLWNEMCEKFDPEGKFRKKYEAEAEKHGIKIPK